MRRCPAAGITGGTEGGLKKKYRKRNIEKQCGNRKCNSGAHEGFR
jgi:hypothetical protein